MQTKKNKIFFIFGSKAIIMKKVKKKSLFLESPYEIIQTPTQFFFLNLKTKFYQILFPVMKEKKIIKKYYLL